jgi:hypothetical protein
MLAFLSNATMGAFFKSVRATLVPESVVDIFLQCACRALVFQSC